MTGRYRKIVIERQSTFYGGKGGANRHKYVG
jgi:hypothetical protein